MRTRYAQTKWSSTGDDWSSRKWGSTVTLIARVVAEYIVLSKTVRAPDRQRRRQRPVPSHYFEPRAPSVKPGHRKGAAARGFWELKQLRKINGLLVAWRGRCGGRRVEPAAVFRYIIARYKGDGVPQNRSMGETVRLMTPTA